MVTDDHPQRKKGKQVVMVCNNYLLAVMTVLAKQATAHGIWGVFRRCPPPSFPLGSCRVAGWLLTTLVAFPVPHVWIVADVRCGNARLCRRIMIITTACELSTTYYCARSSRRGLRGMLAEGKIASEHE